MNDIVFQQILNWVTLGSIYALIATGFSLLFGVLNIIHFSHGDVSLLAPFLALAVIQAVSGELGGAASLAIFALSVLVAIVLTGLIGVILDVLIIQRFRTVPAMMALVATVALGIVLRELIRLLFPNGSNPHAFPRFVSGDFALMGLRIPAFNAAAIVASIMSVR